MRRSVVDGIRSGQRRKLFFFEKKNQKTFATRRTLPDGSATAVQTFFGSFFQKRTASLAFRRRRLRMRPHRQRRQLAGFQHIRL
jgi:hypothetical protein